MLTVHNKHVANGAGGQEYAILIDGGVGTHYHTMVILNLLEIPAVERGDLCVRF